jgi:Asp-tRNA(Asn)/Glu-tRNA(Gln) amidotransferase A subunit family amidase
MAELSRLTASEARRAIDAGRLNPRDLLDACLDRIALREGAVGAFAFIDPDQVRRSAALPGALHGIPIGVKDLFDTADMPTAYGSPIWHGWQPKSDAAAIAGARTAGAIVIGKTVTAEFAVRTPGPTWHPLTLAHTPGGSSSGSAAGVADGFFPLAFGTQTLGSTIKPAAFCGIVGYKPSFGMIHRGGLKLISDELDTIGIMARSVADCALFAGAVSGQDLGDPEQRPDRAPRIGLCRSPAWDKALPETQALIPRVAAALTRAGAAVEERELPADFDRLVEAVPLVMYYEAARALRWELTQAAPLLSAGLQTLLAGGLATSGAEYAEARRTIIELRGRFPSEIADLDILVTPAATGQAPPGLASTGDSSFNLVWTALHLPCVTVPAGSGPDGLPLGIQIVARRGADREALAWAQWVAAALV